MTIRLRDESLDDSAAIRAVTLAAFKDVIHSQQTEAAIVDALRKADVLAISMVAEKNGEIVGHVAASAVAINNDWASGWYGIGPISVSPDLQKQGIGSSLMHAALERIKANGGTGAVLLGDPAYYQRFGFSPCPDLIFPGVPQEYFQALAFTGSVPSGTVAFHDGFHAKDS